jgi:hypothetical protein
MRETHAMEHDHETPRADAIAELLWKLGEFVTDHAELVERALGRVPEASSPLPSVPEPTPIPSIVEPEPEPPVGGNPEEPVASPPPAVPAPPPVESLDVHEALRMLTLGGLPDGRRNVSPVTSSPLLDPLVRCRDLVRAHERGTRTRRRMKARPADRDAQRSLEDRLSEIADFRVTTWLADESTCRSLEVSDLRNLERRYRALNASLGWVIDFFRDNPKVAPGRCEGKLLPELHQRLSMISEAQCGLRTEFDDLADRLPGIGPCSAQDLTFRWLRDAVREEGFGLFLQHLHRSDRSPLGRAVQIVEDIERYRFREERIDEVEAWKEAIAIDEAPEPRIDDGFDSVSDAVDAALRKFGSSGSALVFLPRAIESAEASTFRRPDQVYRVIEALYEVANDWARSTGGMGTSFRERMVALGFDEKPCSDLTMSRYRKHYHADYDRRWIPLSFHVTLGSRNANTCLSIHWHRDEMTRKVVVGHCGRHLPNTLS